jgi:hypothetical protein
MAVMGADCLPDHSMLPEELVFQFFMLGLAWMALSEIPRTVVLSVMASNITSSRWQSLFSSLDLQV